MSKFFCECPSFTALKTVTNVPSSYSSTFVLIGCAILLVLRTDLGGVARLLYHHPAYQGIVVSAGLLAVPIINVAEISDILYTRTLKPASLIQISLNVPIIQFIIKLFT